MSDREIDLEQLKPEQDSIDSLFSIFEPLMGSKAKKYIEKLQFDFKKGIETSTREEIKKVEAE